MFRSIKIVLIAGLMATGLVWPLKAFAGTATLTLVKSTLSNDQDADNGGLWQYEGGTMQVGGNAVGTYIIQRRVTTSGTQTYNTAAETITLFFAPSLSGGLPNSITIEGDYSYNFGTMSGSVSASGTKYHWIIGADAAGSVTSTGSKLVLTWVGSNYLQLP